MTQLDPKFVRKLAHDLLPNLRFSDRERYYPVRAETWLTHTTSAPWPAGKEDEGVDDVASLPVDDRRRGTAVVSADKLLQHLTHAGGPPNLADEALRLSPKTDDPESIAWTGYRDGKSDWFLSFAGWADAAKREKGGDLDYLYDAFSELASSIDHRLAWRPLSPRGNRPSFAHPQPPSPATYCEVDWAGVHPRASMNGGHDFGPQLVHDLDGFLQVTYYYLFPARQPLADPPQAEMKPIEGQWAAVSLFLKARAGEQHDEHGRPITVDVISTVPEWVVFSYDPGDGYPTAKAYSTSGAPVEKFVNAAGRFCVSAYVGAGSHRLFPAPNGETPLGASDPWPSLNYDPGSDVEAFLTPLVIALAPAEAVGALVAWLSGSGTAGDVVTAVIVVVALVVGLILATVATVVILAIILLLCFLVWLFLQLAELWDDDASPSDVPAGGDPPSQPGGSAGDPANGDPAPAGGGQAPPGGAPGGPNSTPDGPGGGFSGDPTGWWPTNEGSAIGADASFFDVMIISRIQPIVKKDPTLAPPSWWDYPGRWGIKIPEQANAEWESGTRRTDLNGRSWAYWNALALVDHLMSIAPTPPGP